jgi:hypothetical protein
VPRGLFFIKLLFQGLGFSRQRFLIADAPVPALPFKHAQFQFRHVEPAPMERRVMKLQAPQDPARFSGRKGYSQRRCPIDVQIVENDPNHLSVRKRCVNRPLDVVRNILFGATVRHGHIPPALIGFQKQEQLKPVPVDCSTSEPERRILVSGARVGEGGIVRASVCAICSRPAAPPGASMNGRASGSSWLIRRPSSR